MIKQPFFLYLSGGLLLLAVGLGVERMVFLATAMETTGTVTSVTGANDWCGRRRHRRECTEFTATIAFTDHDGGKHTTTTGAGSERGHDASTTRATHRTGERLPVKYAILNPDRAYHDSFFDLWMWPLMALMGQVTTMFGAFVEPKSRTRSSLW